MIRVNSGLPASIETALELREGRSAFAQKMQLSPLVHPVVVLASSGGDSSASSGYATAVDADKAFVGCVLVAAGASSGMAQVKNPAGSGRTVYVDAAGCYAFAATLISLRRWDTDLATLVGSFPNKHTTAAGSSAQLRTSNAVAIPGGAVELVQGELIPGAAAGTLSANFERYLRDPIKLDPGMGVMVTINAGGVQGMFNFAIREY
ncbi:MAG TPA: hypothetical protein VFZ54_20525 [Burkholderiales bacterium]